MQHPPRPLACLPVLCPSDIQCIESGLKVQHTQKTGSRVEPNSIDILYIYIKMIVDTIEQYKINIVVQYFGIIRLIYSLSVLKGMSIYFRQIIIRGI